MSQGVAHLANYMALNPSESSDFAHSSMFDDVKAIYVAIQKWIDINDEKCANFTLKFYTCLGFYGKALKVLFKQMEDKSHALANDQIILKVRISSTLFILLLTYNRFKTF